MKQIANIARTLVLLSTLLPAAMSAQILAQIVYVSSEDAIVEQGDSTIIATAGLALTGRSEIKSNEATVIVSICDGSLITIYPESVVKVDNLQAGVVELVLVSGEILGDNGGNCDISVGTKAGEASITEGVFGVVLNDDGENGWTLQVRNLDGTVTFVGQPNLDTSASIVTLLEPNKIIDIPPGEEFIVRGIYDADSDVFALAQEGVALALISETSFSSMTDDVEFMNAAGEEWANEQQPEEPAPQPEEIEVPFEEFDTASEKG